MSETKTLDIRLLEWIIRWRRVDYENNTFSESLRVMLIATLDIADNMSITQAEIVDYTNLATDFAIKQADYNDTR